MNTFVLLLTLWAPDGVQVKVVDHNLTGEDCIAALLAYTGDLAASCELDHGEPWA